MCSEKAIKKFIFKFCLKNFFAPFIRLLASGSDDQKIMIWDPFENKQLTAIETSHRGNIFSVKFLPCNESLVASCAADRDIYVNIF